MGLLNWFKNKIKPKPRYYLNTPHGSFELPGFGVNCLQCGKEDVPYDFYCLEHMPESIRKAHDDISSK